MSLPRSEPGVWGAEPHRPPSKIDRKTPYRIMGEKE
jgi:hypothetical protein